MSRKRIVIDFGAPVPPGGPTSAGVQANRAKKSRRWRKVLGVLLVLVMIAAGGVVIGGYLLWRHYRATPAYSLSLMIDAAQRGDVAEFQKRLDDEAIAKNMVATVSQKASVRYGFALNDKTKQQIDSSMPAILQELKPAINAEVTKQIQAFAAQSKPRPFILLVLAVTSLRRLMRALGAKHWKMLHRLAYVAAALAAYHQAAARKLFPVQVLWIFVPLALLEIARIVIRIREASEKQSV